MLHEKTIIKTAVISKIEKPFFSIGKIYGQTLANVFAEETVMDELKIEYTLIGKSCINFNLNNY